MFYQEIPYFTGDKIKIFKPKNERFFRGNAQFFIAAMIKSFHSFSWGASSFSVGVIKNQKLNLPIDENNSIDFDFIDRFMMDLESEKMSELEAYLTATGLNDYELTPQEQEAINNYQNITFLDFKVTDLFFVKNTKNILSRDVVENSGNIPYLCSSREDNSVSSYISYDSKFLEKGNCIFIGGKTFVVTYQEYDFYSNDSHNLTLYLKNESNRDKLTQIYLSTCINKSLGYKYSWGDSISNRKIQSDRVSLPANNGQPDISSMSPLISAVRKLVIKDVVLFAEKRITAHK